MKGERGGGFKSGFPDGYSKIENEMVLRKKKYSYGAH